MTSLDDAVLALLGKCSLHDIAVRQLSARLRMAEEDTPEAFASLGENEALSDIGMGYDLAPDHADFIFKVNVATRTFEAVADVLVRYEMDASNLSQEVAVHFASRVAFFAAYPYLREVVHSSTQRLPGGQAVLLPLVQEPPVWTQTG